jgi:GTP-binding protein Era
MKSGIVAVIGRPNAGKSTLINALVGQKISIVTNKPQTTRKITQGVYWDERGQVIYMDTPGVFAKVKGPVSSKINTAAEEHLSNADLILYLVDHTRYRGDEENKVLGIVRQIDRPKILVLNKTDIKDPDYTYEYKFLEDEFDQWIEISALKKHNLDQLQEMIFDYLPEGEPLFNPDNYQAFPAINITPEDFISEIIREKAFMTLYQEVPYRLGVVVHQLEEKKDLYYIKAEILTTSDHYVPIIIGKDGQTIKKIGSLARKELELITNRKVYLDLDVTANPHWVQRL